MKKSIQFTAFFVFILGVLIACSKKDVQAPVTNPPPPSIDNPFTSKFFGDLNDAIARFDPLYLQIVYKDKRSREDLNELSKALLQQLNQDPTNLIVQKKLIELYHFESFSALQKISATISDNATSIKMQYFQNKSDLTKEQVKILSEARKNFIKSKIASLEKAIQKKSSGLWSDNAAWILDQYHYYTQVGNLEMGLDIDGAVGNDCNESCCLEYKGCLITAASKYRENFIFLGSSLAASGGALGSLYGSIIPFIGTSAVGLGGGILGGVTGFIQAVNIYMYDQNVCALNYKACIQRKIGN